MADNQQRVALVTGGTRGIGAAITRQLARDGVTVAAVYSSNRRAADQFVQQLDGHAGAVSIYQTNIANPADCQTLVSTILRDHGRVDYLVNNAGTNRDRLTLRLATLDWEEVIRTNLTGAFHMSKAVLPQMVDRGFGRIVNISSIIGQTGNIGQANYAAAKSGLFGLTKTLALEFAPKGVTVNCVVPGLIDTEMTERMPADLREGVIARIPVGRMGTADEVAHAVRFLLADDSAYITGTLLAVNGGYYM